MRHLLVCPEFPPAPHSGGIGTYAVHLSHLLADAGETVHVVCRQYSSKDVRKEILRAGKIIVHRIPVPGSSKISRTLECSAYPAQCFSWEAAHYLEKFLDEEQIDVIESQEYEAPLFYFQLRRALGLGSNQHPPCIIHMHSPTELIARYNDWTDHHHFDWQFGRRLERFSMTAADALLSPSRHLALYAEKQFNLSPGTVRVIPYAVGEGKLLEREPDTWRNGSILFVGRFERRKGILEWIRIALDAAQSHSQVIFEFVGGGKLEKTVRNLVPASLRRQFIFHGEINHSDLSHFLKRARIAVVPSRWENFPNTCIEAMASGLPVIARSNGGMAEMIEDGKSGWLTRSEGTQGLTVALERGLATSPNELKRMGSSAAAKINEHCENQSIVSQHVEMRTGLTQVKAGSNIETAFVHHFPDLGQRKDPATALEQFIREQPAAVGKRAAEMIRTLKRKIKLPVPSAVSQDVYRFLLWKW